MLLASAAGARVWAWAWVWVHVWRGEVAFQRCERSTWSAHMLQQHNGKGLPQPITVVAHVHGVFAQ